jgi:hypothetical protein
LLIGGRAVSDVMPCKPLERLREVPSELSRRTLIVNRSSPTRKILDFELSHDCPSERLEKATFKRTHALTPSNRTRSGFFPSESNRFSTHFATFATSSIYDGSLGMSGAHRLRRLSFQASETARENASFLVRRADTEWALQHHHLLSRVGSRHAARPCCSAADTQNASPGCRSAQRLLSRPAAPKRVGPGSLTNSYADALSGWGRYWL